MRLLKKFILLFSSVADNSPMICLKYFQKFPNVGDVFSLVIAEHYFSKNIIPVKLPDNTRDC